MPAASLACKVSCSGARYEKVPSADSSCAQVGIYKSLSHVYCPNNIDQGLYCMPYSCCLRHCSAIGRMIGSHDAPVVLYWQVQPSGQQSPTEPGCTQPMFWLSVVWKKLLKICCWHCDTFRKHAQRLICKKSFKLLPYCDNNQPYEYHHKCTVYLTISCKLAESVHGAAPQDW